MKLLIPSLVQNVVNSTTGNTSDSDSDKIIRGERRTADRKRVTEPIAELSEALATADKQNAQGRATRDSLAEMRKQLAHLQEDRAKQNKALEERNEQVRELQKDLRAKHNQLDELRESYRTQKNTLATAERRATALCTERDNAQALLKTRTEELRAAEVYLAKTDAVSDADVCRMVKALNAEIFQSAAVIADTCQYQSTSSGSIRIDRKTYDRALDNIGPRLLRVFRHAAGPVDPILIQVAVQACMVKYASDTIITWDLGVDEKRGFLDRVHNHLRGAEPQAVAGRWRMLTRRYAALSLEGVPDMVSSLMPWLAMHIADVLLLAHVPGQSYDSVAQKHGERLKGLVTIMLELRKVVGEDIIASTFEPTLLVGRHDFDPGSMEDGFGRPGQRLAEKSRIRVLCTIALGLQKWEKIQGEGDGGRWLRTVALKPTVVLDTVLTELAQEEEQPKRKRVKSASAGNQSGDGTR